jgi:hypothetical protein
MNLLANLDGPSIVDEVFCFENAPDVSVNAFCGDRAAAQMWVDLASGRARAIVRETPERKAD